MIIGTNKEGRVTKKSLQDQILDIMPNIYRLCFRIVKDRTAAEEASHEVYIAISNRKQKDIENLKFYASAAAVNTCLNIIKKEKKTVHLPLFKSDAISDDQQPLDFIITNEQLKKLSEKIDKLPDDYRIVITLRYLQDFDFAEIAKILGISQGAVRVTLYRALAKLRNSFSGEKNV